MEEVAVETLEGAHSVGSFSTLFQDSKVIRGQLAPMPFNTQMYLIKNMR